jgi:hypothetical protein
MKIWAEMIGVDGKVERRELFVVPRDVDHSKIKDFGLTLEGGKSVLQHAQAELTQFQVEQCGIDDRTCNACGQRRAIHDALGPTEFPRPDTALVR